MLPITEPLSTTYEEDTLERLRSRRMQLVLGNHELELAWVDHRIAEVEPSNCGAIIPSGNLVCRRKLATDRN